MTYLSKLFVMTGTKQEQAIQPTSKKGKLQEQIDSANKIYNQTTQKPKAETSEKKATYHVVDPKLTDKLHKQLEQIFANSKTRPNTHINIGGCILINPNGVHDSITNEQL
ncbi:MAG: hypothetical protein JSS60_02405 [Verrucomicrobia bacterium]|nr:hypothetical protein [Verrucomicrobiota bacterium]